MAHSRYYPGISLVGLRSTKKSYVGTAGVSADNRTEYIWNTRQEHNAFDHSVRSQYPTSMHAACVFVT
jgi:hypothetical protein